MTEPDFDVFKNRWTITATLELETPLHIGGGQNAAAYSISAAPVLQAYNSKTELYELYIPGSSLKGVLRSTVERLIRTFNENKCCISVKGKNDRVKSLCGDDDCITCGIFGSMKAGAKIRVRDSHLSNKSQGLYGSIKEQPHCATLYDRDLKPRKDYKNRVKTSLRMEETVTSGISFDVEIDVDNADNKEIGLLLLALDEFNSKRIYLGGGSSRGNGFAELKNTEVRKKTVDEFFRISELHVDTLELMKEGKRYLKNIDSGKDSDRRDFDIYYKAHSPKVGKTIDGHIVALMKLTTLTDFIMPGVEERTVTSGGLPVIPGSTIKGFFRHALIDKTTNVQTVKELFGYTNKPDHRGRLLFSDAYSDELTEPDRIPAKSTLKMWLVFDNVTHEELSLIDNIIKETQNSKSVLTGKTSAKWNAATKSMKYNAVKMEYDKLNIFRASDYLGGI